MADGHGGYRQPSNPAPVSLPGRESARTDRGPRQMDITGGSYGSGQEFRQQQSSAAMSAPQGAPGGAPVDAATPVPLGAPSAHPDMPVTAGADAGAGPGMADAGIVDPSADADLKAKLGPLLPVFMRMADSDTATDTFKQQVRQLIARLT